MADKEILELLIQIHEDLEKTREQQERQHRVLNDFIGFMLSTLKATDEEWDTIMNGDIILIEDFCEIEEARKERIKKLKEKFGIE